VATNMIHDEGKTLVLAIASATSGAPVVKGQIRGVALTATDTDGNVTVQTRGVFDVSVKGIDGSGNSAVAVGDIIYHTVADTPPLSKKATGVRFGYALEAVASAGTDTIKVLLGY
jgi:predicted RecA/RadA family phage recombinase